MDVEKAAKEALEQSYANIDANVAAAQKELDLKYNQIKTDLKLKLLEFEILKLKQEVSGKYTEQEAQEKLQPVKDAIEAKGYVAGPFETKTHKEWCVDVLGSDPEEYDRQQQEDLDRYTEYDDEENG